MEIAFENVKAALASVGASFENVVKLNNYIVDIALPRGTRQVRKRGGAGGKHDDRRAANYRPEARVRDRGDRGLPPK